MTSGSIKLQGKAGTWMARLFGNRRTMTKWQNICRIMCQAPSLGTLSIGCRENDVEGGPVWDGCRRPQASTIGLYDRPADSQSHPHPGRLGREKGVKDSLRINGIDS